MFKARTEKYGVCFRITRSPDQLILLRVNNYPFIIFFIKICNSGHIRNNSYLTVIARNCQISWILIMVSLFLSSNLPQWQISLEFHIFIYFSYAWGLSGECYSISRALDQQMPNVTCDPSLIFVGLKVDIHILV